MRYFPIVFFYRIFIKSFVFWIHTYFPFLTLLLIALQVYFASWINLRGDVYYNEDIARDFLILENIVTKQPITLIGPRILGIPGLFHGPLWIYINLPAYLIGHGNPVTVGFFWILLYIVYLCIVFFVAKRLFTTTIALFSVLLLSSVSYLYIFNNTIGAMLLFPLYFYFASIYLQTLQFKRLLIAMVLLGTIMQFEIAFGGPLFVINVIGLVYLAIRRHKLLHLSAIPVIVLPLFTHVLFEVRHQFIQTHALIQYFTSRKVPPAEASLSFSSLVVQRVNVIFNESLHALTHSQWLLVILLFAIIFYLCFRYAKNILPHRMCYMLFACLYLGYWIVTLVFKGTMWLWYFYEFTPVMAILFCSTFRLMNKYVFVVIFLLFYIAGVRQEMSDFQYMSQRFIGSDHYSWTLYRTMAQKLYADAPDTFGYYALEHDSLAYRTRYALHYVGKTVSNKAVENTKLPTTYLLFESGRDDPWWKKNRVTITNSPVKSFTVNTTYLIEKYRLTSQEVAIPSDPTLIDSLFFR